MLIKDMHLLHKAKLGFLEVYLGKDVCWDGQLELKKDFNFNPKIRKFLFIVFAQIVLTGAGKAL